MRHDVHRGKVRDGGEDGRGVEDPATEREKERKVFFLDSGFFSVVVELFFVFFLSFRRQK